jgi:sugar/nucleoside kinase (ribokinase family)
MVCDILVSPVSRSVFDRDGMETGAVVLCPGGDALNVSINLAKLGLEARIAGCVGGDAFGDFILGEAVRHGVDTSGVLTNAKCTGTSVVLIEEGGERHFVYHYGGNALFSATSVTGALLEGCRCLSINSLFSLPALEGPGLDDLEELLVRAKRRGILTVMDVTGAPSREKWPVLARLLPQLDYFLPSESEAASLSNQNNAADMARLFLDAGCGCVVIKCGGRGAYADDGKEAFFTDAFPVNQADATGAGDAFVSGFIYGLSRGAPLETCVRYGCAEGALCVTGIGAITATPNKETLEKWCHQTAPGAI